MLILSIDDPLFCINNPSECMTILFNIIQKICKLQIGGKTHRIYKTENYRNPLSPK